MSRTIESSGQIFDVAPWVVGWVPTIALAVLTGLTMSPAIVAAMPWLLDVFGGHQSARTLHFAAFLRFGAPCSSTSTGRHETERQGSPRRRRAPGAARLGRGAAASVRTASGRSDGFEGRPPRGSLIQRT